MEYLNKFHQWGLKPSFFGINNYTYLFAPAFLISILIFALFGGKKSKAIKRK